MKPIPKLFMPHALFPGWLGAETANALLAFASADEGRYRPAQVGPVSAGTVNPEVRIALVSYELGPFKTLLRDRARALAPELGERFGAPGFNPKRIEVEFAAHGDGAHFRTHADTHRGPKAPADPRRISMVYYMFREPRRFSGGQLRYYAMGDADHIDIEPAHDLLLAFPSIARHSVEPVSCPGVEFADWRFAVNMWLRG